jgi:16S rRNA (cytidine1402-2'-O)-methyltransferase
VFEGFFIKERLQELLNEERAIVIYESPKRVGATLGELASALGGERRAAVVKEMTKVFERVERGTLAELAEKFTGDQKGEFVIVIDRRGAHCASQFENLSIREHVELYVKSGRSLTDAMKAAAKDRKISKSIIYKEVIKND